MYNLHQRSFLKESDFSKEDVHFLLELTRSLKAAKYAGTERQLLAGKSIALIFEKPSTRTRCAFETAARDQGAFTTYLGPDGSHIGVKESMKDTARVLGRMYDAIEYRGFSQQGVEELATHSGVPVWNGLTDQFHPTQSLCDIFTMQELVERPLEEISFCYVGDGRNNVANSLMIMGSLMGMDVRIACPDELAPDGELVQQARRLAAASGARLAITSSPVVGVWGADFVYTDVWVSMGESHETWKERIELLKAFQVNEELMVSTGNQDAMFLHCLPALHNRETALGRELFDDYGMNGLEVTDDVFESEASRVFQQAENRMHAIKAIMVATLGS